VNSREYLLAYIAFKSSGQSAKKSGP